MKNLYYFIAHLDDFEISCIGHLFKNASDYSAITIVIPTTWKHKKNIWQENLELIESKLKLKINYLNLGYQQRKLMTEFDDVKDDFYSVIDFNLPFDIVTHDCEDCPFT